MPFGGIKRFNIGRKIRGSLILIISIGCFFFTPLSSLAALSSDSFGVGLAVNAGSGIVLISNVSVTGITEASAQVHWGTDVPAACEIRWGKDLAFSVGSFQEEDSSANHSYEVTGLGPSSKYFYSISCQTVSSSGQNDDGFFVTKDLAKEESGSDDEEEEEDEDEKSKDENKVVFIDSELTDSEKSIGQDAQNEDEDSNGSSKWDDDNNDDKSFKPKSKKEQAPNLLKSPKLGAVAGVYDEVSKVVRRNQTEAAAAAATGSVMWLLPYLLGIRDKKKKKGLWEKIEGFLGAVFYASFVVAIGLVVFNPSIFHFLLLVLCIFVWLATRDEKRSS